MSHLLRTASVALAIAAPLEAARAQDISFGVDALAGIVDEENTVVTGGVTGGDDFSGGVLPSVRAGGLGFSAQADGLLFDHRGDTSYGVAAHLGANIAVIGYLGIYGSVSDLRRQGGLSVKRIGGEFDFDLGMVGITAVAGYEDTEAGSFLVDTTETDDVYDVYDGKGRFFSFSDARFKPSDKFRLSLGHRYTGGRHAAAAGIALGLGSNVALMAEGRVGEGDYKAALAGVRVRFGVGLFGSEANSMLDNRLLEDMFAPANTRRTVLDPLPPPDDDDDDDDCGSCGGYCEA
jgi:hypothetical protein